MGLLGCSWALLGLLEAFEKARKISPGAPKMRPKWLPGGLRGVPGGSLEPLGRPWGAEGDFRAILGAFWEAFGEPKLLEIDAKIEPAIQ